MIGGITSSSRKFHDLKSVAMKLENCESVSAAVSEMKFLCISGMLAMMHMTSTYDVDAMLDVICGLSLLLVLFSAPRGFSLGTPVFPSPQKPTFLNSNSIRNARAFNT